MPALSMVRYNGLQTQPRPDAMSQVASASFEPFFVNNKIIGIRQ